MTNNIFKTVNSVNQLGISKDAQGLSKRMVQVRSSIPIGANWATTTEIQFEFQCSGNQWWSPSESYYMIDATLSQGDGTILIAGTDDTGWALNAFSGLFSKAQHHIQNEMVSESNHPAREDTCIKRLSLSTAYRNSTGSAQSLQPLQTDREASAVRAIRQTYYYQPKMLSIYNYEGLIPQARHRTTFQKVSGTDWQLQTVEAAAGTNRVFSGGAGDLASNIHDIVFYAAIYEGSENTSSQVLLDLDEFKCRIVNGGVLTEQNHYLNVEPSTTKLALAVQGVALGTNSHLPITNFTSNTADASQAEDIISKVRLDYANQTFPTYPYEATSGIVNGTTARTSTRLYIDSALGVDAENSAAGAESETNWMNSGPIMVFPVVKNSDDRSTSVNIQMNFSAAPTSNTNLLLFNQYRKVAQLQYDNGELQQVSVSEI